MDSAISSILSLPSRRLVASSDLTRTNQFLSEMPNVSLKIRLNSRGITPRPIASPSAR
jgi:hypothetical protein